MSNQVIALNNLSLPRSSCRLFHRSSQERLAYHLRSTALRRWARLALLRSPVVQGSMLLNLNIYQQSQMRNPCIMQSWKAKSPLNVAWMSGRSLPNTVTSVNKLRRRRMRSTLRRWQLCRVKYTFLTSQRAKTWKSLLLRLGSQRIKVKSRGTIRWTGKSIRPWIIPARLSKKRKVDGALAFSARVVPPVLHHQKASQWAAVSGFWQLLRMKNQL